MPLNQTKPNQIHKLYPKRRGKLQIRISCKRTNASRGENSQRHVPRKLTLATAIRYANDNIQLRTDEVQVRLQICKIIR